MRAQGSLRSMLEALLQAGADQWDPVRFRYLRSLERRLRTRNLMHGPHWQRLTQAVSDYQSRFEAIEPPGQPPSAPQPAPSPLSALVAQLDQSQEHPAPVYRSTLEARVFGAASDVTTATPALSPSSTKTHKPLRAMARVQAEHGTQALQDRICQAIANIPEEAGPMNAHRLVSRAIAEMQRLSPEYIERFARYTDTLMTLERMAKKG